MKCCKCSGELFEEKSVRFTPTIKNEMVDIIVPSHVCRVCGSTLLNTEQVNYFRRTAADKFREAHGLLTSREIINMRKSFGLSQKAFAEYLGVGEASIKRWETYYVQDVSQDDHIRVKCDLNYAEMHYLRLLRHFSQPDIYNGLKPFSFDLFKQVILFFAKQTPSNSNDLAKLSFYADFFNFKRNNKSITGTRYIPTKSGPAPDQYLLLLKILERQKNIAQDSNCYHNIQEPDLTALDDAEKHSLNHVYETFHMKSQCISTFAKSERAYLETEDFSYVKYSHATALLI